jgi:hypothetical protein
MYVFRKYKAAQYHLHNVTRHLKEEGDKNIFKKEDRVRLKKALKVTGTIEVTANHYVYELSAFLEAMKSTIDFLATVVSVHLKGIK